MLSLLQLTSIRVEVTEYEGPGQKELVAGSIDEGWLLWAVIVGNFPCLHLMTDTYLMFDHVFGKNTEDDGKIWNNNNM
jgi:hypothetical protein